MLDGTMRLLLGCWADAWAGQLRLWPPDQEREYSMVDTGGQLDPCSGPCTNAAGSEGIRDDLINAGATWTYEEAAFRDGNIVWGRVVPDIPSFCRELVQALARR